MPFNAITLPLAFKLRLMEAIYRPSSRVDVGLNRPSARPLSASAHPIKLTAKPLLFPLPFLNRVQPFPNSPSLKHGGHCERAQSVRVVISRPYVHSSPTLLHDLVETKLTVAFSLFLVHLARDHATRSLPRHCEHLQ